jgi:hypothetical protein
MKRNHIISALALALTIAPPVCMSAETGTCRVSLTQDPLVMRLGKDEFRIAFGLDGTDCKKNGCAGKIKYHTTWEGEDGTRNTEQKSVNFAIPSGAERSLTVDRSYFDSGEARQTTQVVRVDVGDISCSDQPDKELAGR